MKMIAGPLRVPGTSPKTEFEAFDALVTLLIRVPKLACGKTKTIVKKKTTKPRAADV
jgi:hypothetical protein